jgi:SAM-dependent methyltransferase
VKVLDSKIFGKSALGVYFRLNEWLLGRLPAGALTFAPVHAYGRFLHAIARQRPTREVYFGTFFLRNRPQLDLALRLIDRSEKSSGLKLAILGCSIGAETYSIVWSIRAKLPDIKLVVTAVDISGDAIEFARRGVYSMRGSEFTDEQIFARLTQREMGELFRREGDDLSVQEWVREGIAWEAGDAADPALASRIGPQDMIFANNFLCHLYPADAERCLRSIVGMVRAGGYLFVSGVDLDVRTRVARDLKLEPVTDLIEEIHAGDSALTKDWPLRYWGLEPFDRRRADWKERYSSVFRVSGG